MRPSHLLPGVTAVVVLAAGCASTSTLERPATPPAVSTTERIDVTLDHCFVEPVSFDGEDWNVPFDRQFGWGGLEPADWRGSGMMHRVAADRARFEDDGGSTVIFRQVDDPAVSPVEDAVCL